MSNSVLFDAPGPRTVLRHRLYSLVGLVVVLGVLAFVVYRLNEAGQFEADKWEVFTTPEYVQVILVDGLLNTLKMAGLAILGAVVLGFLLGVGKLSEHRWVRWPSWLVVEFFRALPVLLLMVFTWYLLGIEKDGSSFWAVVIALTLYNGAVVAEVLRAGVNAVPKGQRRGGVRDRHAQDPGDEHRADAAGGEDHAAGDHQPVRRGPQGHRARPVRPGPRPHVRLQADLPRVQQPGADDDRDRRSSTSRSTCC